MASYTVSLIDQVTPSATRMTASMKGCAAAVAEFAAAAGSMTAAVRTATPALKEATGAAQSMAPAASGATSAMAALGPEAMAVAAAVTAAVAVVTGLTAALYEAARAAVAFTEMRAGMTASLDALTGQGPEVVSMLDQLGKALPFTTQQMGQWSAQLASAGVRDLPGLKSGVMAVASSIALMREQADPAALVNYLGKLRELAQEGKGEKFDTLAKKLRGIGVDVSDVASQLGTTAEKLKGTAVDAGKLGDAIQNALINKGKTALEVFGGESAQIWAKFKENVASLFSGIGPDVQAFMSELRGVAEEFTKDSATANLFKSATTSVFHALFSAGTTALHAIHIGFLDLEIAALKVAIAIAPAVKRTQDFFKSAAGAKMLENALTGIKVIAIGVGAAVALAAVSVVALGVGAARVVAEIGQIASAIGGAGSAISSAASAVSAWAKSSYKAASDFVGGLVSGLTAGIGRVVAAAKNLGTSAVNAVKSVLHIQSPSRVMAEVGLNTAKGMAGGISEGEGDVSRAARRLGGAAVGGSSSVTNNGGARSVSLKAELHIHNHGGSGFELTEIGFGTMIERLAAQAGIVQAAVST